MLFTSAASVKIPTLDLTPDALYEELYGAICLFFYARCLVFCFITSLHLLQLIRDDSPTLFYWKAPKNVTDNEPSPYSYTSIHFFLGEVILRITITECCYDLTWEGNQYKFYWVRRNKREQSALVERCVKMAPAQHLPSYKTMEECGCRITHRMSGWYLIISRVCKDVHLSNIGFFYF